MSGICGIIRFDGAPAERAELERMAARAAYRGPDGIHYHFDGPVGVACLALDATPDGTGECRPLVERDRRLTFAADARLDNRGECAAASHRAETDQATDAELMLGMLLHAGEDGPGRLLGDFAYALWDDPRRELRLARDTMGLRSLYYRVEPERVLFATEARQILAADGVPRRLNERAVAWHLSGMQIPPGCVFYDGIEEVRPGEEVTIVAGQAARARPFWRPDPERRLHYRDEREYADHLRELLTEAVCCRLRTRSPAGISLSGGVDSSVVASIAGWLHGREASVPAMRAYSWIFSEMPECDERDNIHRVADHFGIPVHAIPAEETYPLVDELANRPHEDDPFTSMFQPFMHRALSSAAKDGVAVMFYGFRGDVMCGGNVNDVPGMLKAGQWHRARDELGELSRVLSLSTAATLHRYLLQPILSDLLPSRARVTGRRVLQRRRRGAPHVVRAGPAARAGGHVRDDFLARAGLPSREPVREAADAWPRSAPRHRYIHIFSPLVMRGVMYAERVSAAHGIAIADPWSDRRIAEFILACPQYCVDTAVEVKRLARRAMDGIMPPSAIRAASKVSPEPLYLGALRGKAHVTVVDLMTNSRCADLGFIDEAVLRERFARFVRDEAPPFDLWPTLCLELWLRRYWP
ncbi:asparagine synthetase B family protein [Halomonas kalidii]|uniref:asparagine synthase (glutamine-hydrolyzing) n=1 Tax=Halomonas kalidii TaxID=3043293 RepID=A0ABT6VKW0_9GAMM|nr:asparagine synthetase B [Halomonas kalidii]MDI5934204.1 asparagine synthetase B [Halomonas kalidii]